MQCILSGQREINMDYWVQPKLHLYRRKVLIIVLSVVNRIVHFYRPPKKLWEGNDFTCVCLFMVGYTCDHYTWCIGPHCTAPSPGHSPWHQTWNLPCPPITFGLQWHPVVITGDLFKLVHLKTSSPQKWHLVMAIEACMVGTSGQYASTGIPFYVHYVFILHTNYLCDQLEIKYKSWVDILWLVSVSLIFLQLCDTVVPRGLQ